MMIEKRQDKSVIPPPLMEKQKEKSSGFGPLSHALTRAVIDNANLVANT